MMAKDRFSKNLKTHICSLMIHQTQQVGEKEHKLIGVLEMMLGRVEDKKPLDPNDVEYVRYKISRTSCFSEKYFAIYRFLSQYHENGQP